MNRREFIKTTVAAAGAVAFSQPLPLEAAGGGATLDREFFELRLYHLRRGPMQRRFDDFYRDAAIPALNRAGISPVGVFSVMTGPDNPTMYVLMPHKSAESFAAATERVRADADYRKAGATFIDAPATDPSYVRVESSFMIAFDGIPKLELSSLSKEKKPRMFELRTYESHSRKANQKKIEMFNVGEIAIFRRVGITPVFFGETLVGPKMPNLTYLVVFADMADHDRAWAAFGGDPEWRELRSRPGYADADIVSNISNVFLRPTVYSQI